MPTIEPATGGSIFSMEPALLQIEPALADKEKLARKNELNGRDTLLMALPNEHQLKFNSYKTAKSRMEAIEKSFGVNTAHGVSAASSKTNASTLPNAMIGVTRLKMDQQVLHSCLILLHALQVLQTQTLRDKAITELRQKIEKAKKERDDLKLTLEKFEGSSKNLSRLLDSQQSDKSKTDLGYDSQGVDSQVLENQINDKYKGFTL
nr:hypothetical protein [Tanacetum cinerariifolium]